ncbi:MAG: molybdopterin-guanine dinucleotide biosynthesis protein B [Promethearchaeota archaeon]|nr:MAG: molybdopterin-guanine dinucleotide biosynthesis protein B [Candidatus Lokiarchaeota archaeon]
MMNIPPQIIALKGYSNTGKTSALESVVSYLTRIGKKSAFIKYIHHDNFSIDEKGKDTWKMRQVGGDPIVSYCNDEIAFLTNKRLDVHQMIQLLLKFRDDLDYIFLEGFWDNVYPKILFFKKLDEVEQLISQILQLSYGNEVLLATFCLSGVYFTSPIYRNSDLIDRFTALYEQGTINLELKMYLERLPILDITKNPENLLEIYESFSVVQKNL